jgi:hypothetical protein
MNLSQKLIDKWAPFIDVTSYEQETNMDGLTEHSVELINDFSKQPVFDAILYVNDLRREETGLNIEPEEVVDISNAFGVQQLAPELLLKQIVPEHTTLKYVSEFCLTALRNINQLDASYDPFKLLIRISEVGVVRERTLLDVLDMWIAVYGDSKPFDANMEQYTQETLDFPEMNLKSPAAYAEGSSGWEFNGGQKLIMPAGFK